ncbi:MAG TPA: patatin-like phospholipase family protein [Clostridiaceae bacterium]|nr:patatin-like phospholipase family protein [Clostridiaceae bacterium]
MYGVALGGGGARGSYELGVLKALKELRIPIGAVTGTSIGAINAAGFLMGDLDVMEEMWLQLDRASILELNAENVLDSLRNGGYDYERAFSKIRENLNEETIRKNPIDLGIVTYNVTTRSPVVIFKDDIPEGKLVDYVLASANHPLLRRYEIEGEKYLDGAIYDNIPVDPLLKKGYIDIVFVNLDAPGRSRHFAKTANIVEISPDDTLGSILLPEPETIARNLSMGYLDTLKAFGKIHGHRYSFHDTELSGLLGPLPAEMVKNFESIYSHFVTDKVLEPYKHSLGHRYSPVLAALEITAELLCIDRTVIYENPGRLLDAIVEKLAKITMDEAKMTRTEKALLKDYSEKHLKRLMLTSPKVVIGNLFIKELQNRLIGVEHGLY